MSANMEQVATYIMENGIEKFRSSKVKEDNRAVFNFVNKNGGFTKFRDNFINGQYDVYFSELAEKTSCTGLLPVVDTAIQEVYIPVPVRENEENSNTMIDDNVLLTFQKTMERIISNQDVLMTEIAKMKEEDSSIELMRNKLKTIENDMIDNIREKTIGMIQKYSYITYGSRTGDAIRRGYRDMYDIFDKCYDVNIESIQLAYIKKTNTNRMKNGKPPIEYVSENCKVRKIDIIERMGMLTEFYLIVKSKLDNLIPN